MAERTETLVHAHRGWVADVSHQLRTPLTALRLRLDVLAGEAAEASAGRRPGSGDQPAGHTAEPAADTASASQSSDTDAEPAPHAVPGPSPEFAAELAGVQEEIERLSRLVDGLLAVARAESVVARREAVAVDDVAAERVAAWEPLARENGQELVLGRTGGRAVSATLAPGDLEQILDNVIANALAAVPGGGHVRVESSTDRERDRVIVQIADDGPGMSEAVKQTAFRRFGTSTNSGSGLGLAIVDRLATANGGEVRLTDTPGGGLTVVVELPTASPSASSSG
jgi:signal transduction histidine kinase